MGGRALKLEATHLRQMLLPVPTDAESGELQRLGSELRDNSCDEVQLLGRIDGIVADLLRSDSERIERLLNSRCLWNLLEQVDREMPGSGRWLENSYNEVGNSNVREG